MSRQRIVQVGLVVASSLLVTSLAITNATANLAGCDNCIEAGDIATGAVNAAELDDDLNNSITANDIASGAVRAPELNDDLDNSITANDIGPGAVNAGELGASAKVAAGSVESDYTPGSNTSTSPADLDTFRITVPATGNLWVQASGEIFFDIDSTDASSDIGSGYIALCDAPDTILSGSCGGAGRLLMRSVDPDNASNSNSTRFFAITRVLPVTAGTKTLYLNGTAAAAGDGIYLTESVQLTALFVPGSLAITTP